MMLLSLHVGHKRSRWIPFFQVKIHLTQKGSELLNSILGIMGNFIAVNSGIKLTLHLFYEV